MKRVLLLFVCLVFSIAVPYAAAGKPNMVIEQAIFDAGEVLRTGIPIEHAFRIKNTGTANLTILSVKPG